MPNKPKLPTAFPAENKVIKCVVWDLDHTLWDGTLLEGDQVSLREGVVETLQELDRRGILNSIASKNDLALAMARLKEIGLADYFLYPEINWNPKSASLAAIARSLNLGLDTFAFIDDQPFERAEVAFAHPHVLCLAADDVRSILGLPALTPRFVTSESRLRRQMYLSEAERQKVEEAFEGTSEEFLATLQMRFWVRQAQAEDLQRAEELTVRTHQLNTTGATYTYAELETFRRSPNHLVLVAALDDKFGTYGIVGLALIELNVDRWVLKLVLMSCRVLSRGVGAVLLNLIRQQAKEARSKLKVEFIPNDRNRKMYITLKLVGFKEVSRAGDTLILENDFPLTSVAPPYLEVISQLSSEPGLIWNSP